MPEDSGLRDWTERHRFLILAILTIAIMAITAMIALRGQQLTPFESSVIQGFGVALSIYGGVIFSRKDANKATRAAARASARRVLVSYEVLNRTGTAIEEKKAFLMERSDGSKKVSIDLVHASMEGLSNLIEAQIQSADPAIEDWRDIAPQEVEEEISRFKIRTVQTIREKDNGIEEQKNSGEGRAHIRRPRPRSQ